MPKCKIIINFAYSHNGRNMIVLYVVIAAALYVIAAAIYLLCNKGMARNARGQQLRRFVPAALFAVLPSALLGVSPVERIFILPLAIGLLWMVTYPLFYHLTYRKSSPDYENYMDITFGLYLVGWLSSAYALIGLLIPGNVFALGVMAFIELVLCMIALFQWAYYIAYKTCVDTNGIKVVQETNVNEIIEFFHSFPLWATFAVVIAVVAVAALLGIANIDMPALSFDVPLWRQIVASALILVGVYIWKGGHGVFVRTGMAQLYRTVKDYIASNERYRTEMKSRYSDLQVKALGKPWSKPSTVIMVIGESGCRDFMSAWHPDMKEDTTPWMRHEAESDPHFMIFPNAYSCAMQTVPALERALTERNQYNDKPFFESCSIVDIAHKLGYNVHWYSNQGHLGTADTPVTLVADTADVAKWTKQEVNKVQYDSALLDFYKEIDPAKNNFIVFHLKGSHFNFLNRYPREFTRWGESGVQDNVVNYENSIAYTDSILQQMFEYARRNLNLQAFVYFSDHATEPGRRRKPNFDGFQMTRIPLAVWLSDEYVSNHPLRYEALKANQEKYFTNDLAYDLMCGVFDIDSNRFDSTASLADKGYRFTRDELLTYEGSKHISEDNGKD